MSTPPEFKSNLPESLLTDINPRDRYLLEQVSVIGQKSDWLLSETQKQSNQLTSLDEKLRYTNGKIGNAILEIQALKDKNAADKEIDDEVKKIVGFKLFFEKYILNKYSLGAIFIFSLGFIKVMANPELREFLFKIIGLG